MSSKMDYQFPQQLFPAFYNCGPPDLFVEHRAGTWGSYDTVIPQGCSGPLASWTFTSRYQARGNMWCHTESVPIPLLSPKNAFLGPLIPPDPLDFTAHMQNFFIDHCQDAFCCTSDLLGENFYFRYKKRKERYRKDSVNMWKVRYFLDILKYKICQQSYCSSMLTGYCSLLSHVIHGIPPELLGSLLYEELIEQRDHMLLFEKATGGALVFIPFSQSSSNSQHGCLVYPGSQGMDCLNFHKVELQYHGVSSCLDAFSSKPVSFQLKAPIRQISYASHSDDSCVAMRSDHLCGVWRFSERNQPRLLQVVNSKEVVTCINVSPHILGEVLVANERVTNLWTVGQGMQKVRMEDSNLYFNAKSSWRWCEFSAHPRVMLYADRTGVELTDMRAGPLSGHTLFRISSTSECRSGERLILSRYLGDDHSFHHLITTQYSAYIMDERFPCVPMLKWDHMMLSPPVFCYVAPKSATFDSVVGESHNTKVLLGSHSSQEITLLQYSGGRVKACFSQGPPQALLRPRESLKHLPVQIPHRLDTATNRLSSSATGMTCIQKKAGRGPASNECMCVLQLTEAGDIFYQVLEHILPDHSTYQNQAGVNPPQQGAKELLQPMSGNKVEEQVLLNSQVVISESSEDTVGPPQGVTACTIVAATPKREKQIQSLCYNSSSESEGRSCHVEQMQLYVYVNEDRNQDQLTQVDSGIKRGNVGKINKVEGAKKYTNEGDTLSSSSSNGHVGVSQWFTPVKISNSTFITWKHWLQRLMQKTCEKKPCPQSLQHFKIMSKHVLHLPDTNRSDASEKGDMESLGKHIKSCMSRCSLLLQRSVSASLGVSDVVPVPSQVDTKVWTDPLSHRLTLTWQGESAWRAWWEEQLGMNRESKLVALRRKRRKEKDAKRAAGHRLELSGSFTSSSYQSELDDFSSSTGWSSAISQGAWSDREVQGEMSQLTSFLEYENKRATPSSTQTDSIIPTPTTSCKRMKRSDQQISSGPCALSLSQRKSPKATPTSPRKTKHPADSLSSPFSTQDDFLEKRNEEDTLPVHPAASSSQLHSQVPGGARLTFSTSQSSQGHLGLSQTLQHKKKPRMGF